jgi:hypothetical protein
MKIKIKILILTLLLTMSMIGGCAPNNNDNANPPDMNNDNIIDENSNEGNNDDLGDAVDGAGDDLGDKLDAVTSASVVDSNTGFKNAIGTNGTWIICTLKDLSFDEDLVLEGEFKNGKQDEAGKDIIQRKIALYEQDEKREVTDRYKLTAPKLTIESPNARIQSGTFIGDLYVSAANFELVDTKVEGNVYFTTDEAESTFKMDDTSSITGKKELMK